MVAAETLLGITLRARVFGQGLQLGEVGPHNQLDLMEFVQQRLDCWHGALLAVLGACHVCAFRVRVDHIRLGGLDQDRSQILLALGAPHQGNDVLAVQSSALLDLVDNGVARVGHKGVAAVACVALVGHLGGTVGDRGVGHHRSDAHADPRTEESIDCRLRVVVVAVESAIIIDVDGDAARLHRGDHREHYAGTNSHCFVFA